WSLKKRGWPAPLGRGAAGGGFYPSRRFRARFGPRSPGLEPKCAVFKPSGGFPGSLEGKERPARGTWGARTTLGLPGSFFLFLVDEFVDLTTAPGSPARG